MIDSHTLIKLSKKPYTEIIENFFKLGFKKDNKYANAFTVNIDNETEYNTLIKDFDSAKEYCADFNWELIISNDTDYSENEPTIDYNVTFIPI
jgi:hypothetical protein